MKHVVPPAAGLAAALLLSGVSAVASPPQEASNTVRAAVIAALPAREGKAARITRTGAMAMSHCTAPLRVSFLGVGAYRTAQVVCTKPAWTLYVEVAVERDVSVLVATRAIAMGRPIGLRDFRVVRMPANDVAGARVTAEQATGLVAASPISVGQTITQRNVVLPLAVRNGERVTVHVSSAGADVTMTGTALQSGGVGQSILVDNDVSHRRVTVVITTPNSVPPRGQLFILAE